MDIIVHNIIFIFRKCYIPGKMGAGGSVPEFVVLDADHKAKFELKFLRSSLVRERVRKKQSQY